MNKLEIEYIEETQEYNISGLKYSVEEAKEIAFFIETKEMDKELADVFTKKYTQQDVDRDDAQQEILYKRGQ